MAETCKPPPFTYFNLLSKDNRVGWGGQENDRKWVEQQQKRPLALKSDFMIMASFSGTLMQPDRRNDDDEHGHKDDDFDDNEQVSGDTQRRDTLPLHQNVNKKSSPNCTFATNRKDF